MQENTSKSHRRDRLHIRTGIQCNNRCIFCVDGEKDKNSKVDWVALKRTIETELDENRGIGAVSFTTGEPTLNPFLPDFVRRAKALGYASISIVTNGRAWVDKHFCEEMAQAGITNIVLSIHGPDAATHDMLTGNEGSFAEASAGLANLAAIKKQFGFHLATQTVINKFNVGKITDIIRMSLAANADAAVFAPMEPRGNGLDRFDELAAPYPAMGDAFRAAQDVLGENAMKNKIRFEPAPPCIFRGIEYIIGDMTVANVRDKETGGREVLRAEDRTVKGLLCASCLRENTCPGIWKLYSDKFGWDGFEPFVE